MAILNGKFVKDLEIDPLKHKFIGSFRPPQPPSTNGAAVFLCVCGQSLWTVESVRQHWQSGCLDIPQYSDM